MGTSCSIEMLCIKQYCVSECNCMYFSYLLSSICNLFFSDAERKRKVGQIMSGLQIQEGDFKKMKKKK